MCWVLLIPVVVSLRSSLENGKEVGAVENRSTIFLVGSECRRLATLHTPLVISFYNEVLYRHNIVGSAFHRQETAPILIVSYYVSPGKPEQRECIRVKWELFEYRYNSSKLGMYTTAHNGR